MDKFGYIRGRRGPPGPAGKDAVNIFTWFPLSSLQMFRQNSECTFYFNTADDGILKEGQKPVGLKDRYEELKRKSGVRNAICIQNFHQPQKLKSHYFGLPLKNSLYKISNVRIAAAFPSILVAAFSFRVTADLSWEDTYIFTDKIGSRGVVISKEKLNILGSEGRLDLEYEYKDWNTMIIQYSNITEFGQDQCIFELNERRGYFKLKKDANGEDEFGDLYLGGHPEKRDFASVILGNFELYSKIFTPDPPHYILPDGIIKELNADMNERV